MTYKSKIEFDPGGSRPLKPARRLLDTFTATRVNVALETLITLLAGTILIVCSIFGMIHFIAGSPLPSAYDIGRGFEAFIQDRADAESPLGDSHAPD